MGKERGKVNPEHVRQRFSHPGRFTVPIVAEALLPLALKGSSDRILLDRASKTLCSDIKKIKARLQPPAAQVVPGRGGEKPF